VPNPTHIRATIVFDAGKPVGQSDMEALTDGIIDLLDARFPGHSGSLITADPVNEDGHALRQGIHPPSRPMPNGFNLTDFMNGCAPEDIAALGDALDREPLEPS